MDPSALSSHFGVTVFTVKDGPHPQARCFADADESTEKALFIAYQPSEKNRYYMWFPDYDSFIVPYSKLMDTAEAHFYEVIRNRSRFFVDVDATSGDVDVGILVRAITELRPKLKNPIITTAHGPGKWSYHLVYKQVDTMANHAAFMADPSVQALSHYAVDFKVYTKNRNMRLLGSTKYGQMRFLTADSELKRKKDGQLTRHSINKMARGFVSVLDHGGAQESPSPQPSGLPEKVRALSLFEDQPDSDCHSYTSSEECEEGVMHRFRRVAGSYCKLCNRTHDNDNTCYLFEVGGKVFRKCFKGKGAIFLGHTDEEKEDGDAPRGHCLDKVGRLIEYDTPYCSHNAELLASSAGIIAQRARMGTGKTNAAAQRIRDRPDARALVISFRISLTAQYLKDKFDGCGMVGYLDVDKLDDSVNRLVIQPESMHRLRWSARGREFLCDEVIIDECSQVIRQLTSTTFTKQKHAVRSFKVFKQVIKYAKTVHLMDANLTHHHVKFFQALRGNVGKTEVYLNEHNNFQGRMIHMSERPEFMDRIYRDVEEGQQIYIATNGGENKIQALKQAICVKLAGIHRQKADEFEDSILTIYQGTMSDPRVIEALQDPNGEWGKYRVVIASPSVQSGVSYDKPGVFSRVYGLFSNFTNSSTDAAQMLCRVRHPMNDAICCVEMRNNNIGPLNKADLIKSIQTNEEHLLGGFTDYEIDCHGVAQYNENEYFRLWSNNEISRNYDLLSFKKNFIRLQEEAGLSVVEIDKMPTFEAEKVDKITGAGRGRAHRHAWELLRDAPDIDDGEASQIKDRLNKSEPVGQEDMTRLKRYNILCDYGLSTQDIADSPEWFKTYSDTKKRRTFKNSRLIAKGFNKALSHIKTYEQRRREDQVRNVANPERELTREEADMQATCDMINYKNRYKMWDLVIGWVHTLGYQQVGDEVPREDVKARSMAIRDEHCGDLETLGHLLGKSPHRLGGFAEGAKFASVLKFINGSFEQLGLSLKAKRGKPYKLVYSMVESEEVSVTREVQGKPYLLRDGDGAGDDEADSDTDDSDDEAENPFI